MAGRHAEGDHHAPMINPEGPIGEQPASDAVIALTISGMQIR
jgi:hypothetical protein